MSRQVTVYLKSTDQECRENVHERGNICSVQCTRFLGVTAV
jgi:hypothetical protein